MAKITFYSTTLEKYSALSTKDNNALYFLTNGQLYKGDTLIGNNVSFVTDYPGTGESGILYVTSNGESKVWNGSSYVTLSRELATSLSEASTDNQVPSAKAVYDLLQAMSPDGYTELVQQVATNKSDIATLTEELEKKADAATTLAGYGILDAYTSTQTDEKIAEAVADASHLKRTIVTVLPEVADTDENTIYMILKTDGSGNQLYDEYFVVNGAFEKIGDTAVDLTNYVTTEQLEESETTLTNLMDTKIEEALSWETLE